MSEVPDGRGILGELFSASNLQATGMPSQDFNFSSFISLPSLPSYVSVMATLNDTGALCASLENLNNVIPSFSFLPANAKEVTLI